MNNARGFCNDLYDQSIFNRLFRFYATVIENPFDSGGRQNSLLVVDIRFKKDDQFFNRDHCWIKHKKFNKPTSMFNSIQIGDKVEFSAKLHKYKDSKGNVKIGLTKITSIHRI